MANIMSLDIGNHTGISIYNTKQKKFLYQEKHEYKGHKNFFLLLNELVSQYLTEYIVIGEAMGQRQVVKQHSKVYGIVELLAEKKNIQVIYCTDLSARKQILTEDCYYSKTEKTIKGLPKVATGKEMKDNVVRYFQNDLSKEYKKDSDVADSMLFAKWLEWVLENQD